jgi:hypothetical protein
MPEITKQKLCPQTQVNRRVVWRQKQKHHAGMFKKGFDPRRPAIPHGGKTGRSWYSTPRATIKPRIQHLWWAAGFLEGEGSFGGSSTSEMVSATQVQREPLERLQAMFGGTIKKKNRRKPSEQPAYVWSVSGARARGIMLTLFVLMSPKRQGQIRKGLHV